MVRNHLLTGFQFGAPAPDLHLYSDASCSLWGAHLLDQHVSGVWSDQEKLLHINVLEMKALFLGLQAFRDVIGHHVTAMCDNSTVVAYVNKQGGTVSRALCLLTSPLLRWTESFDFHLDARYLPGQDNVLADVLSRRGQAVGTEWSLHPQVARSLLRVWGNPSIDLFATCLNAKLPLYCSLVPDPQAVFEDAFRHPWDDLDLYAFPPLTVGRVIARVRESSRFAMTLVAPLWPEKEWFADLLLLLNPTTSRPALVGQSASAAPLQPLPPRRPCAEPSRVATLKCHFRKSGFSGRAAGVLSWCLRSSTSRLYQSRWQIFCGWCRGRGVAPVNATVRVVVDFLIHLRHDKGLSVSAVKGYSSALNSVLALKGRDLASSGEIALLLRSFSRSVDPVELRPPAWDVALVLQSLTGAPYEPLRTCEERFLAQKTLFLLALASAKRVLVSFTLCRIVSLIPRAGLRFPFLSSWASWQRLRIPLPLLLGLRALLYRPYQTRGRIAMGDCYVLCGRSGVTSTALLHIVRVVSGCLSPQGVARRRYRRPLSPSGSGRRYHVLTSSLVRNSLFLPLELVRHSVLLCLFFSRRTSLSTRC